MESSSIAKEFIEFLESDAPLFDPATTTDSTLGIFPSPDKVEPEGILDIPGIDLGRIEGSQGKNSTTFFETSMGPFMHGGISTAASLVKIPGYLIPGKDVFERLSEELRDFGASHPEWAPKKLEHWWELFTEPENLWGHVSSSIPFIISMAGAGVVGGALRIGTLLPRLFTAFAIEGDNEYRRALSEGATSAEAKSHGIIAGAISAAIETAQMGQLFSLSTSGRSLLRKAATQNGRDLLAKTGMARSFSNQLAVNVGIQGLEEAVQGTSSDLLALGIYGSPEVKERGVGGFFDSRMQEFIVAGTVGGVAELGKFAILSGKDKESLEDLHTKDLASDPDGSRRKFKGFLVDTLRVDEESADSYLDLMEDDAEIFGERYGVSREKWFETVLSEESEHTGEDGRVIQGPKGWANYAEDGKSILEGLKQDSVTDLLIQWGGVFRGRLMEADLEVLSEFSDTQLVRSLETFLEDGTAPNAAIKDIFSNTFIPWGTKIFRRMKSRGTVKVPESLNEELLFTFTDWSEGRKVLQRRHLKLSKELADANEKLEKEEEVRIKSAEDKKASKGKKDKKADTKDKIVLPSTLVEPSIKVERLQAISEDLSREISDIEKQISDLYTSKIDSEVGLDQAIATGSIQSKVEALVETPIVGPYEAKTFDGSWWSHLYSMSAPLRKYKAGQILVPALDNITSIAKSIRGKFDLILSNTNRRMSRKDIKQLKEKVYETDRAAFSLLDVLLDRGEGAIPDAALRNEDTWTEGQRSLLEVLTKIQTEMGSKAGAAGVIQELSGGLSRRFRSAETSRRPRILTPRALQTIIEEFSSDGKPKSKRAVAIVEAIASLPGNPSIKAVQKTLHKEYSLQKGEKGIVPRAGRMLEHARVFKQMPTYYKFNGRWETLLEVEPARLLERSVELQALKVAVVQELGQGKLTSASASEIHKRLTRLADIMGVKPTVGEALTKRVEEAGTNTEGMTLEQLEQAAKDLDQSPKITNDDLIEVIDSETHLALDKDGEKALIKLAKELKGIDTREDIKVVFNLVKERLKRPHLDVLKELRAKFIEEAGEGKAHYWDDTLKVAFGLPFGWLERSTPLRVLRLMSSTIGSLQTSLAVSVNLPQTFMQVPKYVGLENFSKAVNDALSDYRMTRNQMAAMGAFEGIRRYWGMEHGYRLESIGRNIRQLTGKFTGLSAVTEFNNVVASRAGWYLGQEWRERGLEKGDEPTAVELRLTAEEIDAARKGEVSDDTLEKMAQNMAAITQFVTEAPQNKGKLENMPLLRMIFSYNSYALGTHRANMAEFKSLKRIFSGKETTVKERAAAFSRFLVYMGSTAGVAWLSPLLRNVAKGRVPPPEEIEDKALWEKAMAGLFEVQMLGAVQRVIDPFRYSGMHLDSVFLGAAPQAKAVSDLVGALLGGFGRHGAFGIGTRLYRDVGKRHAPVVKAFINWADNIAFPHHSAYRQTRAQSSNFSKKLKEYLGEPKLKFEGQISPLFDGPYQAAKRYDLESLVEESSSYYREAILVKKASFKEASRRLRASLLARAPIPFGKEKRVAFLLSLERDEILAAVATDSLYRAFVNSVAPSGRGR